MLVCCNSNAACDEIAERLIDHLAKDEIFRIFAKSYDKDSISPKIRPICNLTEKNGNGDQQFRFPSFEFLFKFRVVITTLLTAGTLARGRGVDPKFTADHFSHIFIDEAASVHEPASFIPLGKLLIRIKNAFKEAPLAQQV